MQKACAPMTSMDSRSSRLSMLCVAVAPCAFRKCTSASVRSTTWSRASLQGGRRKLFLVFHLQIWTDTLLLPASNCKQDEG